MYFICVTWLACKNKSKNVPELNIFLKQPLELRSFISYYYWKQIKIFQKKFHKKCNLKIIKLSIPGQALKSNHNIYSCIQSLTSSQKRMLPKNDFPVVYFGINWKNLCCC